MLQAKKKPPIEVLRRNWRAQVTGAQNAWASGVALLAFASCKRQWPGLTSIIEQKALYYVELAR